MKQTIASLITGLFVSLPFLFNGVPQVEEYHEIQPVIVRKTTEELFRQTDLYKRTLRLEKQADSLHQEVEKLRNEKDSFRLIKITERKI